MLSFVFHYAFRNLFRHHRRSFLTIGTVALSTIVTIVGFQYADAVLMVWKQGAIDHGAGHAQIHKKIFFELPDILTNDTLIDSSDPFTDSISGANEVLATAKRLIFEGIISFGKKTMYFQGKGIDPENEQKVSPGLFGQELHSGRFLENKVGTGITIGKGLADALEVKVGDEVTLMTNTLGGAVNGIDVVVEGILDFPVPAVSKRLLYMNIKTAQNALATGDKFSELAIRLNSGVDSEKWLQNFRSNPDSAKNLATYDIKGWWEIEPMIRKVEEIWHSIMGIIIFLLFSTAGLSVLNIIYLLVTERIVEIGTLMSLGAKSQSIRILFAMEAGLIGVVGGSSGAVIPNFVLLLLKKRGVPFASPFASGSLIIYPQPDLYFSVFVSGFAIFICLMAAIFPAEKAAKVTPLIAFRGQLT